MNDVVALIFSVIWIPTAFGVVRCWSRYWRVRHSEGAWLLLLLAVVATLATPLVTYISLASANRLMGNPPFEYGIILSIVFAFLASFIVPVIEIGFWLWERGAVPDPVPPLKNGDSSGS